jgi:glycosyltransferase involved in cell wall biosynthesis
MVVGIDVSRYGHPEATGVEWYSFHLLNELLPLLGREHNAEVRLYSPADFQPRADLPFNVRKRIIPFPRFWTLLRLSAEMILKPVDLLFVPSHTLPFFAPKKSVITIHDVAFKYLKDSYSWFQTWLLNGSTKKAVKKAWKLIVPSEATKRDLVKFYRCAPEKIVVIPHGSPEVAPFQRWTDQELRQYRDQFFLKAKDLFILYVGRLEAKKNLKRLVEAFARFSVEFPGWKLILAGKRGLGFEDIWKKVMELRQEKNVIAPGYITEREKTFLMEHCRIFAFPSLYEGFGLPVLEAFAHRKPVLTSKTSSLPEVAGDAAFLVNPEEVAEISVGLKRLASDGVLVTQLVGREEKQLKQFSWEQAAKATFDVLFGF